MTIFDGDITRGYIRDRVILKLILGRYIPKPAYEYAKKISSVTGLPLEEVLNSEPVRNYIRRFMDVIYI